MRPTEDLINEHIAVVLALRILERMERALDTDGESVQEHLGQLIEFFKGFVDRCHHGKEEDVLFPELEKKGVGREGGPIGVMLTEHEIGRKYVRAMSDGLQRMRQGDAGAVAAVLAEGRSYRQLLSAHIRKENNVLFPMADKLIGGDLEASVNERFEEIERNRVGEGKHEAYHQMLQHLKEVYKVE